MLKISYTGCLGLSLAILAQFTPEMCVAARNREKFTKNFILRIQCHSRSSMLTFLRSLLSVIRSMSVPRLSATIYTLDKPIGLTVK